jgi:hypothetical protein
MKGPSVRKVWGQPSFVFETKTVQAALTVRGGHLAPVTFHLGRKKVQPFSVAPWAEETLPAGTPDIVRVLRGDFFCMPFGGNTRPYRGEKHPPHGETANRMWQLVDFVKAPSEVRLHLAMNTEARPGQVDKIIRLLAGQSCIYQEHIISGMAGPMCLGHHATLKFPDRLGAGRFSTSRFVFGQTFVEPTERPENRGYSILKPGAVFKDLTRVPMVTGEMADLSRYPARRGYEDIAGLVADARLPVAWNAVAFPEEGYVWFSLKDPRVLASTLLWMSNGGRHYAPWNGRHVNVMGVEDLTSYFHAGLAESASANSLSKRGLKTCHQLNPRIPLHVRYIMGVAASPRDFDRVQDIVTSAAAITLVGKGNRKVRVPVDVDFLIQGE